MVLQCVQVDRPSSSFEFTFPSIAFDAIDVAEQIQRIIESPPVDSPDTSIAWLAIFGLGTQALPPHKLPLEDTLGAPGFLWMPKPVSLMKNNLGRHSRAALLG